MSGSADVGSQRAALRAAIVQVLGARASPLFLQRIDGLLAAATDARGLHDAGLRVARMVALFVGEPEAKLITDGVTQLVP